MAGALSRIGASGSDAKNCTVVYFRKSTIVNLNFGIEPLWCEVEGNVVVGDSNELGKLGACDGNQALVIGGLGDKMSSLIVDENDGDRHDWQCVVG